MYQMQNGLLYRDGRPIFALGQSYYPSYHPQKVPVLETGDRLGEMEKDLRAMKAAGFHLVRMAALGDVTLDGEDVRVRFDLPDAFCQLCQDLDLAAMIRLQGYSMNLRGFEDAIMIDQDGNEMPFHWGWFLRSSLNHPGILQDNVKGTVASAAHFKGFPSVVSFQIYNEPAYPHIGFYDYHPFTIERYRGWLAENGHAPEDPPHARPAPGEDPAPWVRWRLFSMERMSAFLCEMSRCAKEGYAAPETLTCHMSTPITPGAAIRGENYFETAAGMDILGITAYLPHRGPAYHVAGLQLALAESAAATFGKHCWLIEYNARTDMPPQEWQRETIAAIGHGIKGILYYQWRADYPFADGPEPEGFGLLMNDGRKTPVFDTAIAMNGVINGLAETIASMEKARCGVGILFSNHANALSDALDNRDILCTQDCHERAVLALRRLYALMSERSIPVDFTRPEDLAENPLGIRTLLIPMRGGLSGGELDAIDAFVAGGGRAFVWQDDVLGYLPYDRNHKAPPHGYVTDQYDSTTLLDAVGVTPPARVTGAPCADARLLTGDGEALCCIVNYDPLERPIAGAALRLSDARFVRATAYGLDLPQAGLPLEITCGTVSLPAIRYGAFIHLKGE